MLGEIRSLEEMCDKYQLEINDLEKELMKGDLLENEQFVEVRERISVLKKNQSSRMSMLRGSVGYS